MKKLVVVSDNHGDQQVLEEIKRLEPDADYYIHCGDSEASHKRQLEGYVCVAGNNDWGIDLPRYAQLKIEDVPILITHGQFYGYLNRSKLMIRDLKKYKCKLMLSGHTHFPLIEEQGPYIMVNPGSTSWPRGGSKASYAIVYLDQGKVVKAEIIDLNEKRTQAE